MKRITKFLAAAFFLVLCFTLAVPVASEAAAAKRPAKVTSVKAALAGTNKAVISYKKVSKAKGYQIQYSTKSSMKSAKTVKTTKTRKTLKGLKASSTYYIRVRAYNTVKKRIRYGAWSKTIKLKLAHKHKWVAETVVDKKAWDETVTTRKAYTDYKYVLRGLRDNVYGTFYPVTPYADNDDAWYDALIEAGQAHAKVAEPYLKAVVAAINEATSGPLPDVDWDNVTNNVADAVKGIKPASALVKPVIEKRSVAHPAQTKVIHHDAVSHTETVCSVCGQKKTHSHKWTTRTVVDKAAWDETVIVKEGYEIERTLESSILTTSSYYPGEIFRKGLDFVKDIQTKEFYYDSDVYLWGSKAYSLAFLADEISGGSIVKTLQLQRFGSTTTLTSPYRPDWVPAETEEVHHKAVTHKETLCSICGRKK